MAINYLIFYTVVHEIVTTSNFALVLICNSFHCMNFSLIVYFYYDIHMSRIETILVPEGTQKEKGQVLRSLSAFVIHLNKTIEGSTCLISKTSLIYKQKTNILPNISQCML